MSRFLKVLRPQPYKSKQYSDVTVGVNYVCSHWSSSLSKIRSIHFRYAVISEVLGHGNSLFVVGGLEIEETRGSD